ncbi:dihydrofolate reductase family protein [Nocardia sp. NPDC050630]|uniref:dihydrofolate reductase family protein n=1 Tax=Nocardia sp. NPDC050630 TaxID=3364321 RepID=UPI0037AB561D
MRKLIVVNIMSLDGYFEGQGGNVMALPMDESFDRTNLEHIRNADTVLLGGTSYRMFSGFWPNVEHDPTFSSTNREFAKRYNAIDKVVVSDHAELPPADHAWARNTRIVPRSVAYAAIAELKQQQGGDIVVFASRILWHDLLIHGLVDELHVVIGAATLGGGTPIFTGNHPPLRRVETRTFDDSDNIFVRYVALDGSN